jgi:DNA-binding MarR family transcriptional regulator
MENQMINQILQSFNILFALDDNQDADKTHLLTDSNDPELQRLAGLLSTRDALIIAKISQQTPFPQKELTTAVRISQPTASRTVKHLATLGLINRERMTTNKKEWQLVLTPLGTKVASAKKALDISLSAQVSDIASHYTEEELKRFNEFINEIINLKRN